MNLVARLIKHHLLVHQALIPLQSAKDIKYKLASLLTFEDFLRILILLTLLLTFVNIGTC